MDGRQPRRILSTVSCIFSGAGVTEWMGRLYPRRFPREDVDFDSSAVSLCGEVYSWGKLSFSWGVINVLFRSTRKFMAISFNEAMLCQPLSHGSPAMGACSKQVVCHWILSHRKEHHYKKNVLNKSKQIWGCDPKSWHQQHSDRPHSSRHHRPAKIISC